MSLDPSLKSKNKLAGVRSVMTRAERITKLTGDKRLDMSKDAALGLPKTKPVTK